MKLFDNNLNKDIVFFLTPFLKLIPNFITPNFITIFGGVFSVTIILLSVYFNNFNLLIFGSAFCLIFDILDGAVARFRKLQTDFGSKLDGIIDVLTTILLILSLKFQFGIFEGNTIFVAIFLYIIRIVLILRNIDSGFGGYRAPLLAGIVFIQYIFKAVNFDWVIYLLIFWSVVAILISLKLNMAVKNSTEIN